MDARDVRAALLVADVYAVAEQEILREFAAALRREAFGTAEFLGVQRRGISHVVQAVARILTDVEEALMPVVAAALEDAYRSAWDAAVEAAAELGVPPSVGHVSPPVVTQLAREAVEVTRLHHRAILRTVEDTYRRVVSEATLVGVVKSSTRGEMIQGALERFADLGIRGFVDKGGGRWRIESYAEMAVRTSLGRARNAGRRDGYVASGVDLIIVSTHPASAPQCEPFQGRVLAVRGGAGARVVRDPVTGGAVTVDVVATLDEAERRGYHHPNCRHVDLPWVPGQQPPSPPTERTRVEYAAEQRQRAIERHIRRWKRREAVAGTPVERRRARAKVREWQAAQREHLGRHEWLQRQYGREQIRAGSRSSNALSFYT